MHPLVRKLQVYADFTAEEAAALEALTSSTVEIAAGDDIARQDDVPNQMDFLLHGFAIRDKLLAGGRRQILSFILPGDLCDIGVSLLDRRDHSMTAMVPCTVARVLDKSVREVTTRFPKIGAALQWASLVEEATSREWIVNVGQRSATERAAHVFCELLYRYRSIGATEGNSYPLPLTQADLAEVLALSSVHVNRTLQTLRSRKLIAFGDRRATVLDLPGLESLAEFDPTYLHLEARYQV